jgi:hypothetical protein
MPDFVSQITNWEFLNEPAYRWAIFFVGSSLFIMVWNDVLGLMK